MGPLFIFGGSAMEGWKFQERTFEQAVNFKFKLLKNWVGKSGSSGAWVCVGSGEGGGGIQEFMGVPFSDP